MSNQVLTPLVDGFKGAFRLWIEIVVAIVSSVLAVVSSFVTHSNAIDES
jgi:hypothetical protein